MNMTNNMYTITRYIYFKNPLGRLYRLTGANVGYTLCAKAATHTACIGCIHNAGGHSPAGPLNSLEVAACGLLWLFC